MRKNRQLNGIRSLVKAIAVSSQTQTDRSVDLVIEGTRFGAWFSGIDILNRYLVPYLYSADQSPKARAVSDKFPFFHQVAKRKFRIFFFQGSKWEQKQVFEFLGNFFLVEEQNFFRFLQNFVFRASILRIRKMFVSHFHFASQQKKVS